MQMIWIQDSEWHWISQLHCWKQEDNGSKFSQFWKKQTKKNYFQPKILYPIKFSIASLGEIKHVQITQPRGWWREVSRWQLEREQPKVKISQFRIKQVRGTHGRLFKKIKFIDCLMYLNVLKEICLPGGNFRVV